MKSILLIIFFFIIRFTAAAQPCSALGQTPATAFPVCGTATFNQQIVPICTNNNVPAGSCGSYPDTNPFWYRFTCIKSGTLGFLVTPNNLNDDYDWSLFDITNRNPMDVYDSSSFLVTYNWSGNTSLESAQGYTGVTGTSPGSTQLFACATNPQQLGGNPPFTNASTQNAMPQIIQGHTYLLLVSHYTPTQTGYILSFNGGTASITDSGPDTLQKASVLCDATTIYVKLSKSMKCSSVAPDGSDFSISPAVTTVVSATGINCGSAFDMDSVLIKLSSPLPPGDYTINAKIGSDGNTLLDDCDNQIAPGDNIAFKVLPIAPTPLDSIEPVGCEPRSLQLVFSKPIQCSSIAPDGSDFTISGPSPVSIISATGNCSNGSSYTIQLILNGPIFTGGIYKLTLVPGSDGNTVVDICNQQTPAGSTINFTASDAVNGQLGYQILPGCNLDSIQFTSSNNPSINQRLWSFDSSLSSNLQNPLEIDTLMGNHTVQLIVSNGVCSDTTNASFSLSNGFKASFTGPQNICPIDQVVFQNTSTGNILGWYWDFGDGSNSTDQNPAPHLYPPSNDQVVYSVKLIAEYAPGCTDTATASLIKVKSCFITVPSAFTPNGDGLNDFLYPLNAYKATNLEFRVYNRYGQLVFETKDWTHKWDGSYHGKPQDSGTFVWTLGYTDTETGKRIFQKGTSILIR